MKITLFSCCLLAALAGCSSTANDEQIGKAKKTITVQGMDSPIIVTDGSTHLKHKGSTADFQITTNNGSTVATVKDSGFTAQNIECVIGITSCPTAFSNLVAGWSLNVNDGNSTLIATIMSPAGTNNNEVDANFIANSVNLLKNTSDTPNSDGTDIVQPTLKFASAAFTNGNGATATVTCATSPCKLKIHYKN
jgi:hypothetical protein